MIDKLKFHERLDRAFMAGGSLAPRTKRTVLAIMSGYRYTPTQIVTHGFTNSAREFRNDNGFVPIVRIVRGEDIHKYVLDATTDLIHDEWNHLRMHRVSRTEDLRLRMTALLEQSNANATLIADVLDVFDSGTQNEERAFRMALNALPVAV